eukprot:SAG31_NODE_25913_length_451_cov_1.605114_1_plen_108_part_01
MHALLAGPRPPKSVFSKDGFDFVEFTRQRSLVEQKKSPAFEAYIAGGTVFINFLHNYHESVGALTCWLSQVLRTRTQTNVYLTPPSSQGFTPHTDSQDVFILQLEGTK